MKEIEIRDLALEDVYNESFYETLRALYKVELSYDCAKNIFYERQHNGVRTLIAISDDFIIGTGSIYIETKFRKNGSKVAHIEDVAISVDYQRMGIGREIVEALIKISQDTKCYKTILCCSPANLAFYEKLGFIKYEYGMRRENLCCG